MYLYRCRVVINILYRIDPSISIDIGFAAPQVLLVPHPVHIHSMKVSTGDRQDQATVFYQDNCQDHLVWQLTCRLDIHFSEPVMDFIEDDIQIQWKQDRGDAPMPIQIIALPSSSSSSSLSCPSWPLSSISSSFSMMTDEFFVLRMHVNLYQDHNDHSGGNCGTTTTTTTMSMVWISVHVPAHVVQPKQTHASVYNAPSAVETLEIMCRRFDCDAHVPICTWSSAPCFEAALDT